MLREPLHHPGVKDRLGEAVDPPGEARAELVQANQECPPIKDLPELDLTIVTVGAKGSNVGSRPKH